MGVSVAGKHVFVNPAYVKMFGFNSSEEVVGTDILDMIADSSKDMIKNYVIRRATGLYVPQIYEIRMCRKDGSEFDVEISVSNFNVDGVMYTCPSFRNITQQKQIREREAQTLQELDDLYNNAPCGYHSVDATGTIIKMNDTELSWLGYKREEIEGVKKISDLADVAFKQVIKSL